MKKVHLIYNSLLDTPAGSRPIRFPRPLSRVGKKPEKSLNGEAAVEFGGSWIAPGHNVLDEDDWSFIFKHPETQARIKRGVFQLFEPAVLSEVATGTIADYSLQDVSAIVQNSFDKEWLLTAAKQDSRPEVDIWVRSRIKTIDNEFAAKREG